MRPTLRQILLFGAVAAATITCSNTNPGSGDSITFTASARGGSAYQWYRNGVPIAGATNATLNRTADWIDHNKGWYCLVTVGSKIVQSNTITTTVDAAPAAPAAYDFYVATNGSDANPGTEAQPYATLAPISTYMNSDSRSGQTIWVKIKPGTYETNYNLIRTYTTPPKLYLDFDSGCVIQKGSQVDESCLQALGNIEMYVISRGTGENRLIVRDFTTGTGNAYGYHSTAKLYLWNVIADNCVDGWTGHNTGYSEAIDSEFRNNNKGACVNADTPTGLAARCRFLDAVTPPSSRVLTNVTGFQFFDCDIVPGASGRSFDSAGATFTRCFIGTPTTSINAGSFAATASAGVFTDCYLHITGDSPVGGSFTRCYGRVALRIRHPLASARCVIDRCCFVDSAIGAGSDSLIFANTYSTPAFDGIPYTIRNSVLRGYTTAIGGGTWNAAQVTNWNANSLIQNNNLFGNTTNVLAGIAGTSSGAITTDPQLVGTFNTTNQADYAVAANSPCVGAGVGGVNIGFTLADIAR